MRHLTLLILLQPPLVQGLTVTTFNVLAAVHRSIPGYYGATPYEEFTDYRESDCESWWRPRAEKLAQYVADELSQSDIILLQEWWTNPAFTQVFDHYTGHLFGRVAHKRPGLVQGKPREDGMAVLIKKRGSLEVIDSQKIVTRPGKIAQIVHLREKNAGRSLFVGNSHLSFPGGPDPLRNERRQAVEALVLAKALTKEAKRNAYYGDNGSHLQIIAGDFNSNSRAKASRLLEGPPLYFANAMSATARQSMASSVGGVMDLGVTHRDHNGAEVSVDHILARIVHSDGRLGMTNGLLKMGYLDHSSGAQIVDCEKKLFCLQDVCKISDHRPVTAKLKWETVTNPKTTLVDNDIDNPLQPYWYS